jgi:NhaP-type Na+/H+ and K+/H+ antiporter
MSSDFASNKALFKSAIAGVSAGAITKIVHKEKASMNQCVVFGGVVGGSIFISTLIEGSYPNFEGDGMSQFTAKLATDVLLTSGATYGASMFAKASLPEFSLSTVGIIVASDLIGEMGSRWLAGDINLLYTSA